LNHLVRQQKTMFLPTRLDMRLSYIIVKYFIDCGF